MASTSPSSSSPAPRSKGMAKRAGNSGCEGGTPPEMDKLLPSLPKDPIAEYSSIATCTPDDDITGSKTMIGATNAITTTEQRGPFCSPAPPPFPFSLSYSSKSDSSGEKIAPGKKSSRNKKDGNKKRASGRSKMADAKRTPPSASSASSSEDPRASVARHPGQPSTNFMQRDGKFQSPAEDPMFAALFASHHSDAEIMANNTSSSAHRSYASPNATKSHSDLQVGKVVTEEETSPPSDGASKSDSQPKQYESHAETPSRGVNLGSSPYHHLSPGHPYYQFPPPAQYFQPSGPGVDDAYHYHHGYQSYDPYSSYAENPPVDGHGTIYDGYYPYSTEYYAGPYPGDGYVDNHDEAFYQQLPGITDRSPGKVSHSSSHSHSPGGTSAHHTETPKKRQASSASVRNDSPYEAMPQLSSATPISAGSPPVKKQRVFSSAWADRFSELLEYKKANGTLYMYRFFVCLTFIIWHPALVLEFSSHFIVCLQLLYSHQGTATSLRSILSIQLSAFGSTSRGWSTSFTRRVRKHQ